MTYTIFAFQTLNLPSVPVDTDIIIYSEPTQTPGDTLSYLIYSGRIVAGYNLRHVDEILAQYIHTENLMTTPTDNLIQDDEQYHTYYLYSTTDDWETYTTDTIRVIYDWSYDPEPQAVRTIKSAIPITLMDYRQFALKSMMSRDGREEDMQVTVGDQVIDEFTIDGSSTWTYFRWLNDGRIIWPQPTVNTIKIAGTTYQVEKTCYNYCLYYLNEWGGYDYMLFAGRELQTDNLERLSYKKPYVALSADFGKVDYQTTINETWSLNTSWMTDTQAAKLKHLFSSNKIWLQDLTKEVKWPSLIPVNITNTSYEHKKWKNQGRRLFSYTIELSASQTKYRV